MITYGFSLQGKSHIRKGVVCQDSHLVDQLENGWYLLAVADGVGSAKHSEEGSQIATTSTAQYCRGHITSEMDSTQVLDVLKGAYESAFRQIEEHCASKNGRIEDYDTTLSVAIYTGSEVYLGHAGDGGIVVKDSDGKYEMITMPQKGEDGISVRPLRAGRDSWEFGIVYKTVTAVLLATDGMLDALLPPLLSIKQMQENPLMKDKQMNVYVTLAEFFLNPACVFSNPSVSNPNQYLHNFLNEDLTNEQFNQCLYSGYNSLFDDETATAICDTIQQYNYCTWKIGKVDDDKTIVCAMNENATVFAKEPEYYAEPDWKALQEQFDRLAYPSLYEESQDASVENNEYKRLDLNTGLELKTGMAKSPSMSQNITTRAGVYSGKPVVSTQQSKAQTSYRNSKKKGNIINVVCFLVITVLATAVVAIGIRVVKGVRNADEALFAEVSTQELWVDTETNSEQDVENEKVTECKSTEALVTQEEKFTVTDSDCGDDNVTEVTTASVNTTSTEHVSEEEPEQAVVEMEIMIGKEKYTYTFPHELELMKERYTIEDVSVEKGRGCYKVDVGTDVEFLIQMMAASIGIVDQDKFSPNDIFSEGIKEQPEERVQSIWVTLFEAHENVQSMEAIESNVIAVNCGKKRVARLGMTENIFDRCRRDIEKETGIAWTQKAIISGFEYQMVYQDITYTVCVENGIVTQIGLQWNAM